MKLRFSKRVFLIRMVLCLALLTSCFDGDDKETETTKRKEKNRNVTYWEDVLEEESMVEETLTEETLNVTYW